MKATMALDEFIKLCDRIANVEHSQKTKNVSFDETYKEEYEKFRWMLFVPGHCDELWIHLDGLMK